jgi:hypothetical protein
MKRKYPPATRIHQLVRLFSGWCFGIKGIR